MKKLFTLLMACMPFLGTSAQQEMTTAQLNGLYKATSKNQASVHDPSVVWEPNSKRYYIFGSHKAGAYTTDMQNWTQANPTWSPNDNGKAFVTPQVKKVMKGGVEMDMPQFNAMEWSARTDAGYNINGNMWAPDVIWNPVMKKWCMYLSINGNEWHSSIILLTSNSITGPYTYQGPVVTCGFQDSDHSYKGTDLELALGTLNALPSRYAVGDKWGNRWPHTIDPAVFYDEEGKLWMAYGSWSGGIWMLELNEETGLRDYDVVYPVKGTGDGVTSDPYFGTKIAGGYYVSGEGSYIEHVGGYYYLFVSYGFFDSVGGYVMREFRSKNPNGPYVDASGKSAIFSGYAMNYGKNADNRGVKVMGAYADWGFMTTGELSQGHNSVIAAEDGRTYLVYHTRFDNGTEGHLVRVHQLLQTKNGWLVASPFEYNGEQITDQDIATTSPIADDDFVGTYSILIHKYAMDYKNREVVRPVTVTLSADKKISGAYTGSWSREEGTGYLKLTMGGVTYNGVVMEQQMDGQSIKSIAFSALASSGVCVWGYRLRGDYALAWQVKHQKMPVANNRSVSAHADLYGVTLYDPNVTLSWTSSMPEVISDEGRYNPTGLTDDANVTLNARLTSGSYFWQASYNVTAKAESTPEADWKNGLVAHYGFDSDPLFNTFDHAQQALLKQRDATSAPTLETDGMRNGRFLHNSFGANQKESYAEMPNPLFGKELADGASLAFWVRCNDAANVYDALYGFCNEATQARLYFTGNLYTGFNDNAGKWLDINHPTSTDRTELRDTRWHHVIVLFNRSNFAGIKVYIDGVQKNTGDVFNGKIDDKEVTTKTGYDYNLIVDHLKNSPTFYLGNGSFWGSANACFDDVFFYDRVLELSELKALYQMCSRVYNFGTLDPTGIATVVATQGTNGNRLYDLRGRIVNGTPQKGIYIQNGKKVIIR